MARRTRRTATPAGDADAPPPLVLAGALDLDAAAPLRAALLEHRGADLALDASAVRHLGALCAQVLASAAATWAADGRSLAIRAPSDAFDRGARLLGLASILTPESSAA